MTSGWPLQGVPPFQSHLLGGRGGPSTGHHPNNAPATVAQGSTHRPPTPAGTQDPAKSFSHLPDKSLLKWPRYRPHNTVWDLVVYAGQLPKKNNLQLVSPVRQGLLLF